MDGILERTKKKRFNISKTDLILQIVDIQDGNEMDEETHKMDYYIICFCITEKGDTVAVKVTSKNIEYINNENDEEDYEFADLKKPKLSINPYFFIKFPCIEADKTNLLKKFKNQLEKKEYTQINLGKGKIIRRALKKNPRNDEIRSYRAFEESLPLLTKYLQKHNININDFCDKKYFNSDSEYNNYGKPLKVYYHQNGIIVKMDSGTFRKIGTIENGKFKEDEVVFKKSQFHAYWSKQLKFNFEKYKSFDGYSTKKQDQFLRITCKSKSAFSKLKEILYFNTFTVLSKKKETFELYESDIPPMLRLFHTKDIKPASWIKLPKRKYSKSYNGTNCQYECEINFNDIQPFEKDKIGPLLIASYDIECTSGDGGFPQYRKDSDEVIQIGTTIHKYGIPEEKYRLNVIFTLKGCDPIPGSYVESFDTEKELIEAWAQFMIKLNPDVITGYNIFGFDFQYLYERSKRYWIEKKDEIKFGRPSKNPLLNMGRYNKRTKYDFKKLQSSALGENLLYFIKMPGRVVFDLMKYVQREFKLQSYKLDAVAQKYLAGMKKDDISPNQIFAYQKKDDYHRMLVAKYCIQDCWLCNKLVMKFCIIENTVGMSNTCLIPMDYVFMRGQGIKAQSLVVKECRQLGYLLPTLTEKRPGTYKGAIVLDANAGYHFYPVSCLDYASLYPSCMISHNLCISTLVAPHTNKNLFDQLEKLREYSLENHNIYQEDNVRKDYFLIDGKRKYRIVEWDNDDGSHERYYYYQPKYKKGTTTIEDDNNRGILPQILQKLLNKRKETKKIMKKEKNPFKKSILDGLQLSYKITANSVYGQLGSSTSAFSMPCVAASVTAVGRQLLELARDESVKYIKELYPNLPPTKPIYGDTDSIFVAFPLLPGMEPMSKRALKFSIDTAMKVQEHLDQYLTEPHKLEYEKTYHPYILFSKKRYVGKMYEFDHMKMKKLDYKGIELKRRDNANIVKKVYKECLDLLLLGDGKKSIKKLKENLDNIINNHKKKIYPIQDFVLTKTLKPVGSYKTKCVNPNCKDNTYYSKKKCIGCDSELVKPTQVHVVLAERVKARNPGNAFQSNERVPYVFTETKKDREKILQGDRVETPDYIQEHNIKIDYGYYINQLENSILQLYGRQKNKKNKEIPLKEGEIKKNLDKVKKIIARAKSKAENSRKGVKELSHYFKIKR